MASSSLATPIPWLRPGLLAAAPIKATLLGDALASCDPSIVGKPELSVAGLTMQVLAPRSRLCSMSSRAGMGKASLPGMAASQGSEVLTVTDIRT